MSKRILTSTEVKEIYSSWAANYDASLLWFKMMGFLVQTYREKAVQNLHLKQGDTVVDLGCGTGLNFELLQNYVGPQGKVIGVDLSEEMLKQAEKRLDDYGWENVELVRSDMADYQIPDQAQGILSTLSITMSPKYDEVIKRGADSLDAGKRMSIFELQKPKKWPDWLVKAMVFLLKSYGTRYEHTKRTPSRSIQDHFSKSEVKNYYFGSVCIATGEV